MRDESVERFGNSVRDLLPIRSLWAVESFTPMRRRNHGPWGGTVLPGKLCRAESGREIGDEQDEEGNKDHNDTADGQPFPEI